MEGWGIGAATVALFVLAWLTGHAAIRALALLELVFALAVTAAPLVAHVMAPTPFNVLYIVAPLAYVTLAFILPGQAGGFGWLRPGSFSRGVIATVGLLMIAVVSGLVFYFKLIHPDLTHQPVLGMHRFTGVTLFAIGVGIAALNAAIEESAYRGVLMQAMDSVFGRGILPILIQAAAFGTFHFNSTEPGVAGIVVTVALGLVLGSLRRYSRGMLAPYFVHVAVDIGVWTLGMIELS
jgi:membrane protease YdiL (CAAX protease family)